MKWKSKLSAEEGYTTSQERIIEKFLLFPKKINHEWRWLENAKILQKAYRTAWGDYTPGEFLHYTYYWLDKEWADK